MTNFAKCDKCGLSLIIEEESEHQCKKVVDFKIEGGIIWMFDGTIWVPRKMRSARSDGFTHRELPDKDFPEPMKDGFKYYASFLVVR